MTVGNIVHCIVENTLRVLLLKKKLWLEMAT